MRENSIVYMSNFSGCTVSECSAKLLDNAKIISPIAAPLLFVAIPGVLKLAAMLSRQVSQFEVLSSSFAFVKTPPLSSADCDLPIEAGRAGGGSFKRKKNYIAKKEFAYRMCARWPTIAMSKLFFGLNEAFAVAWLWCHALWGDVFVIWLAFKWCG